MSIGLADTRYLKLTADNDPVTGCITIDDAGNANSTYCEAGIDRPSATTVTFNLTNSGAGVMQIQEDGIAVCTINEVCGITGGADCTFVGGAGPRSASNADLPIESQGTGDVKFVLGGSDAIFAASDGATDLRIVTRASGTGGSLRLGTNAIVNGTTGNYILVGATGNQGAGDAVLCIADQLDDDGTVTGLLGCMYGTAVWRHVPQSALTITSPTDTTTNPLNAGTACRMSASGAAAWTPAEGLAIDGEIICCTNTAASVITMTALAGVYEGPGSPVSQNQQVCMEYVSDRWVERGVSNNGSIVVGSDLTVSGGDVTLATNVALHGSATGINHDIPTSAAYSWDVNNSQVWACDGTGCAITGGLVIVPTTDGTSTLGALTADFLRLNVNNIRDGGDTELTIEDHLVPDTTDSKTLGTEALQWDELNIDSGSAAAPSIDFDGGENGFYSPAARTVGVACDGLACVTMQREVAGGEVSMTLATGAGSAAKPSIHMTSDTDTGVSWYGSDRVTFDAGGQTMVDVQGGATPSVNVRKVSSGTIPTLRAGAGVAATAPTKPTCDSTTEGGMIYIDDNDDATQADFCGCVKDDATTFTWRSMLRTDTLTGNPLTCAY